MNTDTANVEIKAKARAFSRRAVREHVFRISQDGTVRVWDSIAGHFTTCHGMSKTTQARIRKLARSHE